MEESSKEVVAMQPKTRGRKKKEVKLDLKEEGVGLAVKIPANAVDLDKLQNLLIAKESILKKALNVDDLSYEVQDDVVIFPWFKEEISTDEVFVYTRFISSLCKMSKDSSRIASKQKEYENEKYSFRCFLLRLGYIGDEYKADRKVLLRNLTGSAAFKTKKAGE